MLTKRQNLMEVIKGGNPDRFVNQYEFMEIILEAPMDLPLAPAPGTRVKNKWGITFDWPADQIGSFPMHDDEHKALKDITDWKNQVKARPLKPQKKPGLLPLPMPIQLTAATNLSPHFVLLVFLK